MEAIGAQAPGWHILQPTQQRSSLYGRLSLEWDYCMVHDHQGAFTGSIGYVVADPMVQKTHWCNRFKLLPSGVSVAIAGMFANGRKLANFINFPFNNVQLSANTKSLTAQDHNTHLWATLKVHPDGGLQLEGITQDIEYQLDILAAQPCLLPRDNAFTPVTGRDMGHLPNEQWTVDVIWPRANVSGYIRDLNKNKTVEITGHGYRENAFGQWLFWAGGWDFAVVSDHQSGVQWVWQTYHRSQELSYLDLSFPLDGVQKTVRFFAQTGQLQWQHQHWQFDPQARQKYPLDTTVYAHNQDYRVETQLFIGKNQVPLLYNNSWYTNIYVIFALFPFCKGAIYSVKEGTQLLKFSGQAGGEYSTLRSLF
ncbi:hypothetical protein N836_10635 [Leptolyngbya sp. Heron Island J]|uniref:hypothetical protein n=1 Tax=Leptolyngbya sp. Heron Island J TaxID=1385935 RepID=UPI0003B99A58|nr:hypothetical protein [Leptolyngbya sp. Heron Island J]ESA35714.1 hypothetical protein N836_10635 [Leptolyngbya sp. Heron Island J]